MQLKLAGFNLKKIGAVAVERPERKSGGGGRGYKAEEGSFVKIRHPNSGSYVRFSSELAEKLKLTYESSCLFFHVEEENQVIVVVRHDGKLPFGITYNSKSKKSETGKGFRTLSPGLSVLPQAQFKLDEEKGVTETVLDYEDEKDLKVLAAVLEFEKELKEATKGRGRKKKKVTEVEEGSEAGSEESSTDEEEEWDEEEGEESEEESEEDSEEEWDEE